MARNTLSEQSKQLVSTLKDRDLVAIVQAMSEGFAKGELKQALQISQAKGGTEQGGR